MAWRKHPSGLVKLMFGESKLSYGVVEGYIIHRRQDDTFMQPITFSLGSSLVLPTNATTMRNEVSILSISKLRVGQHIYSSKLIQKHFEQEGLHVNIPLVLLDMRH